MPVPQGLDWELVARPGAAAPVPRRLRARAEVVSLVGFRQRHHERSGQPLDRPAVLGAAAAFALTVEASGPPPHREIAPASMSVTYQYGERGELPPVRLTWHQGENKPEIWRKNGIPQWGDGCLFIGGKGMLLANYSRYVLLPEKAFADFKPPAPTLPRVPGHHPEWLRACKGGQPCAADFEYSGWLTEANHLGNVAYRVGKRIEWDAQNLRCKNAREADALIRRVYRKGWEL